jgi:hypothetical protein
MFGWMTCLAMANSCASDSLLSRAEVKKIDGICGRLPGSKLGDVNWQALNPYVVKRDALRHLEVTCRDSCKGSLALRGDYFIDYFYTPHGKYGFNQPASNSVYAVVLRRGDKTIQSYSTNWEARRY